MKAKIYLAFLLNVFVFGNVYSQIKESHVDTGFFNYAYWNGVADKRHFNEKERAEFIAGQKAIFLEQETHQHLDDKDLVWVSEPINFPGGKGYSQGVTNAGPCTNIDFESGNFTGWTRSTGFNPLTNAAGCCTTMNTGDQTIMSGTANDPYGGFPVVYPGGGSFSLRLGSVATGGRADRISQTFFVTPANANFTYRYASVLNDGGHGLAEQPRFTSEIIDTLGNSIPCTFYQASAGSGVPGYSPSALGAPGNNSPVIYKNWTNVAVDLTPNIGQNVTLRFTVYDCGPSGHFSYAYIDGICTSFETSVADTACPNVPYYMCAPAGFASTNWNGPGGVVNDPNQCIPVTIPGTYTCTTLLSPGCPGPTFTHTLSLHAVAILNFTPTSSGPCAMQYTFSNNAAVNSPYNLVSYTWDFGDGFTQTSATQITPVHTYALPGTYQVKYTAVTDRGCINEIISPVTIFPPPNVTFSPPSGCLNTVTQFSNTSTIGAGTIASYQWNFFGAAPNSTLVNPAVTYTAIGTYTINLSATSNLGCSANRTQTLSIFPPPIISFTVNSLCDRNGTSFAPATSTAIASGSLTQFFWNFGDGGTSTLSVPTHTYVNPGAYNVIFTAISDHNCSATINQTFMISPSPTVAFSTTSINACSPNFTFTNNSGIATGVISHTWSFGGSNTTTALSPTITFPSIGNYTVRLIGVSSLGCGDTMTQYISVYPYPIINFNVPASCENAVITVSTTAVSGSVTSYLWDFGDPASGALNTSTLQNPTHYYSATNPYTLTLNIISNLNCPSSAVKHLTIAPNPVASFNYTTANNCTLPFTYVNNSTVSSVGGSFLTDYKWNFQGVGTSTNVSPGTINFPAPGNYSVSLIAITNHNCSDTAIANITVHPLPVVDFTLYPSCVNTPITPISIASISPVPSTLASLSSYTWSYGDNTFTNTAISAPHIYTLANTYTVLFGATSNMGCSSSATHTVDVYPAPVINFTTSNVCFGNLTQFTTTNNVVPTSTIFAMNWNFGDGQTGSNPTTAHTYSAPGTYVVSYSATTNNECMTVLTKPVVIHPLPIISFTANNGCLNTQTQFGEISSIAVGSIISYSWNFGDNSTPVGAQNPSHTYLQHGTFIPSVTAVSNQGCPTTATNVVTVHPLPDIHFSPPGACANATVQFANTTTIALGTVSSYTWNLGNGNFSNLTNPVSIYPTFGPYTVSLGATSNMGCVKTVTNNLTIHPYPQVTVTPIHNSCINDTALFNTNISIAAGSVQSYSIAYGDGIVNTFTNIPSTYIDKHKYTAYNTYTVTLNAISVAGCRKDTSCTIVVYPKPFVNFTSANFCYNTTTAFTNSSTIPPPYTITDHLWNFNDGSATPTSTLPSPTHVFFGTNTYTTYPVSLTESSWPEGPAGPVTCSLTATKTITIFPRPATSFNTNTVCEGLPTVFNNTTPTLNIAGWTWSFYNNGVTGSLAQNPSFTYSGSSTYTAQLIALNTFGCRDTAYNTISLLPNPIPSFTTNNNCFGAPSIFFNNTPLGTASNYLWTFGTTTISTNTDATYQFPSAGTFSINLTATSPLGCSAKYTSTVTVYPLPQLSFNSSQTCLGQFTQFSNASSGSITAYTWSFGDPISGTDNSSSLVSPSHLYTSPGSYTAVLSAISDKNCTASTSSNVIVHNKPQANFTNTVICVNDKLPFVDLSTSTDGTITSYEWDFNGDNTIDQVTLTPTYNYSVSGNYVVKLRVTTQYGCSDDTARQVFANPKPLATITSTNRTGCPPLKTELQYIPTVPTASYTTTWEFGDGSPASSFSVPAPHYYESAGNYDISLTLVSDMGCITKYNQPGFVTVFPPPVAGFKVEPEQIDEDEPIVTIVNQASSDANVIRYYVSDGSSFGTPNFTHYIKNLKQTKPMVVQIAKNQYGCVDTIMQVLDIKPAYVIYFPNVFTPNGDGTNDDFRPKGVGILKFTMQIFDRWGHQVFRTEDITETWDGRAKNGDDSIKEDTYTWKAQVTDVFNKNHFLIGHVTVIR